jgi:hypothetical protein
MKLTGQMAGAGGSDYYAAGTYLESDGTLRKPIYAVEWAGDDFTVSGVKDKDGLVLDTRIEWIDNADPITTDFGLMTFGTDVYEITSDAAFKCWYVS